MSLTINQHNELFEHNITSIGVAPNVTETRLIANWMDNLVQNGTRHAWRNLSNKPALMGLLMHGAAGK